jgi:hypothetical protein
MQMQGADFARLLIRATKWAQIRDEYERGASLRAVASRHALSHTAVAKKAKAQDWPRPPPEDDGLKLLHIDNLKVLEIDDLKVPEIDDLLPGGSLTQIGSFAGAQGTGELDAEAERRRTRQRRLANAHADAPAVPCDGRFAQSANGRGFPQAARSSFRRGGNQSGAAGVGGTPPRESKIVELQ